MTEESLAPKRAMPEADVSDEARFRDGMSLLASSLQIIATSSDSESYGMLATAVCSLSTTPPSLICCINKTASSHDPILKEGRFSVNVLDESHREEAHYFVSKTGAARFGSGGWRFADDAPPLLARALVAFDCEVHEAHDGFSHTIVVARVKRTIVNDGCVDACLLWHKQGYARSAEFGDAARLR